MAVQKEFSYDDEGVAHNRGRRSFYDRFSKKHRDGPMDQSQSDGPDANVGQQNDGPDDNPEAEVEGNQEPVPPPTRLAITFVRPPSKVCYSVKDNETCEVEVGCFGTQAKHIGIKPDVLGIAIIDNAFPAGDKNEIIGPDKLITSGRRTTSERKNRHNSTSRRTTLRAQGSNAEAADHANQASATEQAKQAAQANQGAQPTQAVMSGGEATASPQRTAAVPPATTIAFPNA